MTPLYIPLNIARICLDCDAISASVNSCPHCGGRSSASVSAFIGGGLNKYNEETMSWEELRPEASW